ncbi:MAG: SMC family ATPase [Myxococcales bacterium]|nr:SMC family ATPase [Myxococcales bacterium]
MKPLKLELEWFGPYTRHSVDFSAFHDEGLFLVHGDTGSGKSTLLDALAWVLYGHGLGARAHEDNLRNKSATAGDVTRVALEFSIASRRYRVKRSMAFERAARRGKGVTTEKSEAVLECLEGDPSFVTLSAPRSVNQGVEALLGLKLEQFARVIVLPQGEFRALLLAPAVEQEKLLEHIFGTALYDRIEDALREMERAADAAVSASRQQIASHLSAANVDSIEALRALQEQVEAEHAAVSERGVTAQSEVDRCQALDRALAERAQRNADRAAALTEQGALVARLPEVEAWALERDQATEAASLAPLNLAAQLAKTRAEEAAARLSAAQTALREATAAADDAGLSDASEAACEAAFETATRIARDLSEAAQLVDTLRARRAERGRAADTMRRLEASRAEAQAHVAKLDAQLREHAVSLAAIDQALSGESKVRLRQQNLSARRDALSAHEDARKRLEDAERQVRDAARGVKSATRGADEARAARDEARRDAQANLAAQLAANLCAGEACPVCGSAEHPAPARASEILAFGASVDDCEEALERALNTLGQAKQRLDRAQGERDVLQGLIDQHASAESASPEQLDEHLAQAEAELQALQRQRTQRHALTAAQRRDDDARRDAVASAQARATELAKAEAAVGYHDLELDALNGKLSALSHDEASVARDAVEANARLAEAKAALKRVREARARRAEALRDAGRRLEEVAPAAQATRAEAEIAHGRFNDGLERAGFADRAELERASRTDARRSELERWLLQHQEALDRVAARLAGLGPDEPAVTQVDLDAARGALSTARRDLVEALQARGRLDQTRTQLERTAARVDEIDAQSAGQMARWREVKRVSGVVTGANADKIRLSRFVLLEQFDRVVSCASARFEVMSDGRFTLHRSAARERGKEFELAICDAFTGTLARPVSTLSGGEMFVASLAMALGLGDVLQAWAGGVRIESLFVDEGFGSLDEEALDKAVSLLERLPEHARLVGVVSHVAELRKRIPARLEVVRTEGGSVTQASVRMRRSGAS